MGASASVSQFRSDYDIEVGVRSCDVNLETTEEMARHNIRVPQDVFNMIIS